jgi:hypothetical protein
MTHSAGYLGATLLRFSRRNLQYQIARGLRILRAGPFRVTDYSTPRQGATLHTIAPAFPELPSVAPAARVLHYEA